PAAVALLVVVGWALREPDDTDEILDPLMLVAAVPGAIVAARTVARALRSAMIRAPPLAGTDGLFCPPVPIDPSLTAVLEADELDAVRAHDLAHAHHRDPLRIWVAQVVADLQWPSPSAALRLRQWLHALELARDEEAREHGIEGASLAAAVVNVAR